jgi:8-oxo-dGTP diphosphatase
MTFKAVRFPVVLWKHETATFVASGTPPNDPAVPAPAALVFPFYGDKIVLADIVTRGWCIPSGHVEAGETFEEAVRREAREEAGVTLGRVACLGYFILTDAATGRVRHAPTYVGEVLGMESDPPLTPDSRGRQLVNVEDVAGLYFAWDDLLAAVFAHAYEEKQRLFLSGVPLSTLTGA